LRQYKRELNKKFPDPEKKADEPPTDAKAKGGKKEEKPKDAKKMAEKTKDTASVELISKHDEPYGNLSEIDSVIDDSLHDLTPKDGSMDHVVSFTDNPKYM